MPAAGPARFRSITLASFLLVGLALAAEAQSNSWTNGLSGRWQDATNWQSGAPNFTQSVSIANAGTKTVTIDATTSGSFTNTLTVTNLTISGPTNTLNTLLLANSGTNVPLHVINNLAVVPGGALTLTNAALTVDNGNVPLTLPNGSEVDFDATVVVNNSVLNTSNALSTFLGTITGNFARGTLLMTNSTFIPFDFGVGDFSDGTATFVNSTVTCEGGFGLGRVAGFTGTVSIIGGQFTVTNDHSGFFANLVQIGDRGTGVLNVSNATVRFGGTTVGDIRDSSGAINLQSGSMTLGKTFLGTDAEPFGPASASGTLSISAGTMSLAELHIGYQATGMVSVAGGTLSAPIVTLGDTNAASGLLNITGGTALISSNLFVGTNGSSGSLTITSGALYVTNATHNARMQVNGGTFYNLGGTFVHDGDLLMTNGGTLVTASNYVAGASAGSSNHVAVSGSSLVVTNAVFGLGNNGATNNGAGIGTATVSNATLSATTGIIGSTAGGLGTLTLQSNALATFSSNLTVISSSLSSTSSVTVASGAILLATNGSVQLGPAGNAEMDVSGLVSAGQVLVGGTPPNARGFLHLLGGHVQSPLISANQIVIDGGDLDGTGGSIFVGLDHDASVTVNSGTGQANNFYVGFGSGTTGTFIQNGGTLTVSTAFTVGDCDFAAVGNCTLNSGSVCYVTNSGHMAHLVVKNGTFVLNPGATLEVDNLDLNSSCGQFRKYPGSTLTVNGSVTLDPNLDSDGDGMSNAAEAAAGTDPLDPTSALQMVSAVVQGSDVVLTWTSVAEHQYVVQRAAALTNGQLTDFSDLSPVVPAAQSQGSGVTSWRHAGGAMSANSGYYRVRINP